MLLNDNVKCIQNKALGTALLFDMYVCIYKE